MSYLTARGWLTEKERKFIYNTAAATRMFANILDIGVEYGASVVCMLEGNPSATVTGVDIDNSKYAGPVGSNLKLVTSDSLGFLKIYPTTPRFGFDFVFVDGKHTYDYVLEETTKLGVLIKPGGVLSFHDCYSWDAPGQPHAICPEVTKAVDDWFETNKDKFEELPYIDSIRAFRRKE